VQPKPEMPPRVQAHDFFPLISDSDEVKTSNDNKVPTKHFKFSGCGGQGILSLSQVIAKAARQPGSMFPGFRLMVPNNVAALLLVRLLSAADTLDHLKWFLQMFWW
jgi:hypothetical protein